LPRRTLPLARADIARADNLVVDDEAEARILTNAGISTGRDETLEMDETERSRSTEHSAAAKHARSV